MLKIKHYTYGLLLLSLPLISCAEVTSSSGKVLDNANSVIKSGSENLWVPPTTEEQEEGNKNREPELQRY